MKLLVLLALLLMPSMALAQPGESYGLETDVLARMWQGPASLPDYPSGVMHVIQIQFRSKPGTDPLADQQVCPITEMGKAPGLDWRWVKTGINPIAGPFVWEYSGWNGLTGPECIYVDAIPGNPDLNNDDITGGPDYGFFLQQWNSGGRNRTWSCSPQQLAHGCGN